LQLHRTAASMNVSEDTVKTGPQHLQLHRAAASLNVSVPFLAHIPEQVLQAMALPSPYPCDNLNEGDIRKDTCGKSLADGFDPRNWSKDVPHDPRTMRLKLPIGSLPCCPTPPHCNAPVCRFPDSPVLTTGASATCTKYSAGVNFAFMVHPSVWPAYYGAGGSYDLDVQKHWDVLGIIFGCQNFTTRNCRSVEPFDLAIDLGADYGTTTERLSLRNFARDYIMVDGYPGNKYTFEEHFGNPSFVSNWSTWMATYPDKDNMPRFEFLTYALGNASDAGGILDLCDGRTPGSPTTPCPANITDVDSMIPGKLSNEMQIRFARAQSAYIKIDVEGMDQAAIDGMRNLLNETRGTYADGRTRYLVDFMMLEFCPSCMEKVQKEKHLEQYDLETLVKLIESLGFEVFLIGPRYLPLSHGSWNESFNAFSYSPQNSPLSANYPGFKELVCPGAWCTEGNLFAADLFVMRSSQPHATQIKLALGACVESREFDLMDPQYVMPEPEKDSEQSKRHGYAMPEPEKDSEQSKRLRTRI